MADGTCATDTDAENARRHRQRKRTHIDEERGLGHRRRHRSHMAAQERVPLALAILCDHVFHPDAVVRDRRCADHRSDGAERQRRGAGAAWGALFCVCRDDLVEGGGCPP